MTQILKQIAPYFRLIRVGNLTFLAILLYVIEKWVATPLLAIAHFGEIIPTWILILLILSIIFIAAGGYVINDYFDVKIDKINRPDDLIVTRHISRDGAMRLFLVLSIVGMLLGMVVAWWGRSWTLGMILIVIPGLLWFYSASYKRQLLIGNIVVAFMSALVPLLIAIINADYLHHLYRETLSYTPIVGHLYLWCGGFALFAFIITLAREIVKDIEDKLGDCEMECRTIPVVWGDTTAKIITTSILITAAALIGYVAFAVLPFPHEWRTLSTRYVIFGLITPIIGTLILLWSAKTPQEYHRTQLVIKFVMFMGVLYSFVIQQNLLSL